MKIKIVNLGGIGHKFIEEGISFYKDRINFFCNFEIILPSKKIMFSSSKEKLKRQAEIAKKYFTNNSYVILLDLRGKQYLSSDFAKYFNNILNFKKDIVFIIGGDEGVDDEIREKASEIISVSNFTFNHEIVTLILCEIIYRSFCILSHHPYHK